MMRLRDFAVLMTIIVVATGTAKDELSSLMEEYWNWKMAQFPEIAISSGLYEDRLTKLTLESYAQIKDDCSDFLERLMKIKKEGLEEQTLDNYEIFQDELTTIIRGYKWAKYGALTPVNWLAGQLQSPYWPFEVVINEDKDQVNYVKRLRAFVQQISQGIDLMKLAIKLNRTVHNVTVHGVPEIIEFNIDYSNKSSFLHPFTRSAFKNGFSEEKGRAFYEEAKNVVFNEVNPALKKLVKFIKEEYMNHTRRALGVGSWDSGAEYYKACLDYHISMDMTPQEVHDLGLKEVARIEKEMKKVQRRIGFTGSFPEFFKFLRENRTADFYGLTEEEILERYKQILVKRIHPKLKMVSSKNPNAPLTIRNMPFNGPAASYGVPGVFYVNTRKPKSRDTYTMMSIALHEGNPGHHLQVSLQQTLDLPKFRLSFYSLGINSKPFDFPSYTAYIEGWALYAEFLGEELDLYNTSALELFGRYTLEMLRACRLVVDTGIHVFGWSKEKALKYLVRRMSIPEHQLEKEIDRYASYPGQACSYKIGELEIRKLRKEAKEKLGDRFDVVAFNDVVLMTGAAPLTVVERAVHAYITATSGTSTGFALSAGLFHFIAGVAVLLQKLS